MVDLTQYLPILIFLAIALTSINLMGSSLEKARNAVYGGAR